MKKFLCVFLALGLLVSILPSALATDGSTLYIRTLQSYNSRVKLRALPSANGKILGQYYAGTPVFILDYHAIYHGEVLDDWSRVIIGDVEGYMMNEFLVPRSDEKTPGEIFPLREANTTLWTLWEGREWLPIDTLDAGAEVEVLGTTSDDMVHVAVYKDGRIKYGYIYANEVLWTGEHQKARVRALKSADSVPVRTEPDLGGSILCYLYPGTEVQILFSDDVATSGWTRIRIDNVIGYLPDPYLDHSYGIFPFYRPQPAELRIAAAPVYGGTAKIVSRHDLLFVLGKRNSTVPEYLVLFGTWDASGSVYMLHTGYVPQYFITLKVPGGVSARGMLKKSSYLYQINEYGIMAPIPDDAGESVLYPMGSEFQIAYGLTEDFHREGGLLTGYLTKDTAWVYVEMRVPEKYKGVQGYLPLRVVKYDKRLVLPGSVLAVLEQPDRPLLTSQPLKNVQ